MSCFLNLFNTLKNKANQNQKKQIKRKPTDAGYDGVPLSATVLLLKEGKAEIHRGLH
jgi:hypothetical protein